MNPQADLAGSPADPFARYAVLTISHKSAPVEVREKLAIPAGDLPGFLARLRESGIADEYVVLSTCNRTEIYAAASRPAADVFTGLGRFLAEGRQYPDPIAAVSRRFTGHPAVAHCFRVISSLESMVLGETGIVSQVTDAYQAARAAQTTGSWLNQLFQTAQAVNKAVRSGTTIQEGHASVAGLGAQSAARVLGTLGAATVLVVGAGETAETAARALKRHGAGRFIVSNRSPARGAQLARVLDGASVGLDAFPGLLGTADVVVVATAAPDWLVTRPLLQAARGGSVRPLVLLDLSVPRNIEPYCASLAGVTLLDVDSLETAVKQASLLREGQRPLAESIIAEHLVRFGAHLERRARYLRTGATG
ncbi:MAG: glutamyl-tRNA reductase [Verrucomicrobiota bacterium]